jgi:hypothetical protein
MVTGGVPRDLETYPQCSNGTAGYDYSTPTGTGGCTWCVISNAAGNGFGSFGSKVGSSCVASTCTPQRTGLPGGNILGCSFLSKIGGGDVWTNSVVENSDGATPGSLYQDVTAPAYNPLADNYWSESGSPLSQNEIRNQLSNGILGVYIYAASDSFQGYSTGVFDDPNCGIGVDPTASDYGKNLGTDHVVNIVGYGTQYVNQCLALNTFTYTTCINFIFFNWCFTTTIPLPSCKTYGLAPMDYWIVKNSWSQYWGGEGGFIKIRSGANVCNMENYLFRAVAKTYDITWQNFGWVSLPVISPWDPCFNSRNVLLPDSNTPSVFKQLKCYSWLCNDNERSNADPLVTWNTDTGTWNAATPAPAYNPSVFNADRGDNTAAPFSETAGEHTADLSNGYCSAALPKFCSLGHTYCSGPIGTTFTNNNEDQLRAFADVFGILFGLPLVPPVANDQACAYWRLKCLPHRIIPHIPIDIINSLTGGSINSTQGACVNDAVAGTTYADIATLASNGGNTDTNNVVSPCVSYGDAASTSNNDVVLRLGDQCVPPVTPIPQPPPFPSDINTIGNINAVRSRNAVASTVSHPWQDFVTILKNDLGPNPADSFVGLFVENDPATNTFVLLDETHHGINKPTEPEITILASCFVSQCHSTLRLNTGLTLVPLFVKTKSGTIITAKTGNYHLVARLVPRSATFYYSMMIVVMHNGNIDSEVVSAAIEKFIASSKV